MSVTVTVDAQNESTQRTESASPPREVYLEEGAPNGDNAGEVSTSTHAGEKGADAKARAGVAHKSMRRIKRRNRPGAAMPVREHGDSEESAESKTRRGVKYVPRLVAAAPLKQLSAELAAEAVTLRSYPASKPAGDTIAVIAKRFDAALDLASQEEWINTTEAAAIRGVDVTTIRRWCESRYVVATRSGPRGDWEILLSSLYKTED